MIHWLITYGAHSKIKRCTFLAHDGLASYNSISNMYCACLWTNQCPFLDINFQCFPPNLEEILYMNFDAEKFPQLLLVIQKTKVVCLYYVNGSKKYQMPVNQKLIKKPWKIVRTTLRGCNKHEEIYF